MWTILTATASAWGATWLGGDHGGADVTDGDGDLLPAPLLWTAGLWLFARRPRGAAWALALAACTPELGAPLGLETGSAPFEVGDAVAVPHPSPRSPRSFPGPSAPPSAALAVTGVKDCPGFPPDDRDGDGVADGCDDCPDLHDPGQGELFYSDGEVIRGEAGSDARESPVYATDLDGDGDVDVLSASTWEYWDPVLGWVIEPELAWYENLSSGVFGAPQVITNLASGATSVYATDLDGDGDADVLSASSGSLSGDDEVAWYENLGGGVFGAPQVIASSPYGCESVYATDLDGDGDSDVLSGGDLAWYENVGGGVFGTEQVIGSGGFAHSVYATDLDGDGDADVLAAKESDGVVWYENLGGRTFSSGQTFYVTGGDSTSAYAKDLDGDGDADILWISSSYGYGAQVEWAENLGGGVFSASVGFYTCNGAASVHAADLDGDGDADVLLACNWDTEVVWYENLGGGVFGALQDITDAANSPESVYATDLDGDGDLDVLSGSRFDAQVSWYENHVEERWADSDSDGMCDATEQYCSDPSNPAFVDADSDGVADGCDACPGYDDGLFNLDGDQSCAVVVDGLPADCDDADATTFPDAPQLCDGVDNTCAGSVPTDESDADLDGFRGCDGDCDDTNAASYPGAAELCDGADNACAGIVAPTEADADLDGFRVCGGDCDDADATIFPDAAELCDGLANRCTDFVPADEVDADDDGAVACAECDDRDASASPALEERCDDGVDNNCDGAIDEDCLPEPTELTGCGCNGSAPGGGGLPAPLLWTAGLWLLARRSRRAAWAWALALAACTPELGAPLGLEPGSEPFEVSAGFPATPPTRRPPGPFHEPGAPPPGALGATWVGGDYGGADLTVADGDVLEGELTNVGAFTVPVDVTAEVKHGIPLVIEANEIIIAGHLDANRQGNDRPPFDSDGIGVGGGFNTWTGAGQGGAGYGGPGGRGGEIADLGILYGGGAGRPDVRFARRPPRRSARQQRGLRRRRQGWRGWWQHQPVRGHHRRRGHRPGLGERRKRRRRDRWECG
jgi:FG-GAP-like repeat/Putative metal-binding motif